jgi:hypothetical protein
MIHVVALRARWARWGFGRRRSTSTYTRARDNRRTVRLSKRNANRLSIRHADVTTKAIKHVFPRTNCVCLIKKIYEPAFLNIMRNLLYEHIVLCPCLTFSG